MLEKKVECECPFTCIAVGTGASEPPPPSRYPLCTPALSCSSQPLCFLQSLIFWPALSPKGLRPAQGEAWGRQEPVVAPTGRARLGEDIWCCRHLEHLPHLPPTPLPPPSATMSPRLSTAHLPKSHLQAPWSAPPCPIPPCHLPCTQQ